MVPGTGAFTLVPSLTWPEHDADSSLVPWLWLVTRAQDQAERKLEYVFTGNFGPGSTFDARAVTSPTGNSDAMFSNAYASLTGVTVATADRLTLNFVVRITNIEYLAETELRYPQGARRPATFDNSVAPVSADIRLRPLEYFRPRAIGGSVVFVLDRPNPKVALTGSCVLPPIRANNGE